MMQPSMPCSASGELGGNRSTLLPLFALRRFAFFKSGAGLAGSEMESIM
jgi:hypothetical protein